MNQSPEVQQENVQDKVMRNQVVYVNSLLERGGAQ